MATDQDRTRHLMQAHGRCIAAVIFAGFGGCWLLMALSFSQRLQPLRGIGTCAVAVMLAALAVMLKRSLPRPAPDAELQRLHARDIRRFGWINGVTYSLVFLEGILLPRVGLSNYVFPLFVALVGLHFFPMTGFFRHTANRVTGAALVLWAAVSVLVFRDTPYRMTTVLTFGAGIVLCCSAVWAMRAAKSLAA